MQSYLDRAQVAFSDLDTDGFRAGVEEALHALPCLNEPITRPLAANLHRFVGLERFLERNHGGATLAFAAARRIEPNYKFPETFLPSDNPVYEDYKAPMPTKVGLLPTPAVADGYLTFDASTGRERPSTLPTIVQIMHNDGSVANSAYLNPGDPLPPYAIAVTNPSVKPSPVAAAHPKPTIVRRSRMTGPLLVTAGVLTAFSVTAYMRSRILHDNYYDETITDATRLDGLRVSTNRMYWISVGLGAGAAAAGAGFVVVRSF